MQMGIPCPDTFCIVSGLTFCAKGRDDEIIKFFCFVLFCFCFLFTTDMGVYAIQTRGHNRLGPKKKKKIMFADIVVIFNVILRWWFTVPSF